MFTRLPAVALDAINVGVVRWRVGGRQPEIRAADIERQLTGQPGVDPLDDLDAYRIAPERSAASTGAETWGDAHTDWICERRRARGSRRGSIVLLHGWLATRSQFDFTANLARGFDRAGFDVWLPWLPHHGPRTPRGSVSGARCISADLVETRGALRRAVGETRSLVSRLRSRGEPVGLWGVSLGGWIAALTASRIDPLEALLLWAPVADPFDALSTSPIAHDVRATLREAGVGFDLMEHAFAPFLPRLHDSATPGERTLVLGGVYDNVVSRRSLCALASRWDASVRWYPHGHISMLWSPRARREARAWMESRLAS